MALKSGPTVTDRQENQPVATSQGNDGAQIQVLRIYSVRYLGWMSEPVILCYTIHCNI